MLNKLKRFFRTFGAADVGIIASVVTVICEILTLLSLVIAGNYEDGLYELLITAINIIFYISIGRYFVRAKTYDNLRIVATALGILAVFDYIIPLIRSFIGGLITSGIGYLSLSGLLVGSIFGVLYFIFLILDLRQITKDSTNLLIVFGAFIFIGSVLSAISAISLGANIIGAYPEFVAEGINSTSLVIDIIVLFLSVISTVCFGLVYLLYPVLKKRKQKLGY